MKRNKAHKLNEVSVEFAGKAQKSAIKKINRLATEFAESDFKDTEILAKLQKLAQQRNLFTDYINDANNEAADQVVGPLKRVIKKWAQGRTLSNGVVFKPLFTLESDEVLTREVIKRQLGRDFERYKNDVKDMPFNKLIVIGLNSDFDAQIKAGKKFNMDYSQYEQLHDEYETINDELKDDLLGINGISYSWSQAHRRNKRKPYDTITMVFYIDTKLIDTEIMSQKLGGQPFYDTDYRKTAASCSGTKNGIYYSGIPYGTYKTRKLDLHTDEKLNNEKRNNKRALYESIMRKVSKEIKKTLNEFNYWQNRIWQVGGTGMPEKFFDKTIAFYENWCSSKASEVINELIDNGKIVNGMDWYNAWDLVENKFNELLDQAVGGEWWEIGKKLGYDDDDLDRLYTDVMQAKTDELAQYCFNDVIVLDDDYDEDDYDEDDDIL